MPPTPLTTTGRPFHIASATVSPKPSASDFCTTTSARRLQRVDHRARSPRRRPSAAREVHAAPRSSCGSARHAAMTSCEDLGALGVVGDARRRPGPRARGGRRRTPPRASTKPSRTPTGSLSRSQRDTWVTHAVAVGERRLLQDRAPAVDARRACRPRARSASRLPSPVGREPDDARGCAATAVGPSAWFFGEKTSIDGGMTDRAPASSPSQTKRSAREHHGCRRRATYGRRNVPRLADASSSGVVDADVRSARRRRRRRRAARAPCPAVCGSWRMHDVARPRRAPRSSSAARRGDRLVAARGRPRRAAAVARRRRAGGCAGAWSRRRTPASPSQHDPARVDAGAARVGQQRAQHLGHAAAVRRRVHAPDDAAVQQRLRPAPRARAGPRSRRRRGRRGSARAAAARPGRSRSARAHAAALRTGRPRRTARRARRASACAGWSGRLGSRNASRTSSGIAAR